MSKTQASSPFKGGEPVVHHERAARALERLGILCYDVAKPMKECGCQETVFTNSLVGTKTGGRPVFTYNYGFYNTRRIHQSLQYLTPNQFEKIALTGLKVSKYFCPVY
jgi:hypothetical protein